MSEFLGELEVTNAITTNQKRNATPWLHGSYLAWPWLRNRFSLIVCCCDCSGCNAQDELAFYMNLIHRVIGWSPYEESFIKARVMNSGT